MKEFIKTLSELNDIKYSKTMNELFTKKIPCAFFAACESLQYKVNHAVQLKRAGMNMQYVVIVDEPYRVNLQTEGIPIVTLKQFSELENKPQWVLYLPTPRDWAFDEVLSKLGVHTLDLKDARQMEDLYENICRHLGDIFEVYQLFDDEESRTVYRACLKGRIAGQMKYFRYAPEPHYLLSPFIPVKGDIAVDGGVFDGKNSIDFVSCGAKVYSFEMDHINYQNCLPRAKQYNFTLENFGLSSRESTSTYLSGGAGSHMVDSETGGG